MQRYQEWGGLGGQKPEVQWEGFGRSRVQVCSAVGGKHLHECMVQQWGLWAYSMGGGVTGTWYNSGGHGCMVQWLGVGVHGVCSLGGPWYGP